MKKVILILILIIYSVFSYNLTFALENNSPLIKAYNNFIIKLESKVNKEENQLIILEKVKTKIDTILKSKKISTKSIVLLEELGNLNNSQIKKLKSKIENSYYTNVLKTEIQKNDASITYIDYWQLDLEKKERQKFIDYKNSFSLPTFISNTLSSNKKYLYSIYDSESHLFEFLDNNKIKRIIFTNYYEITESNYNLFYSKSWYILNHGWKYLFIEKYEIEEKIPYSESYNLFKWFMQNSSANYYENNSYYYNKFSKFSYINDKYWFYIKNINSIWINIKESILYKKWNNYGFIKDYVKVPLINWDIIKNITNKNLFLSQIIDDKKTLNYETDKYFLEIKDITENLTAWLTKEEKIKKIYDYVLKNITYTNPPILSDVEIFSWIDTYINKDWVCEWYVKLMAYMLMFAWIEDVEVIRWFVINASDFPKVWHAWLKIWEYYYDPTFDDPIWNNKVKEFDEYVYYKLPEDLFYTNRYDLSDLPEEIKTKSKEELEEIISKNLYNLTSKYKNSWYNIMKYTSLLFNNWLNYNDKFDINKLEQIIDSYDVNWKDMTFIKNWEKTYIKKLRYYKFKNDTIINLLMTIKYDLTNKYIFKWIFSDWSYEYRLVYELEVF